MLFGKPVFIWAGFAAAICVILTAVLGIAGAKVKYHKIFAGLSILFILVHFFAK